MKNESEIRFPCPVLRIRMAWRKGKWQVIKSLRVRRMTLPRSLQLSDSELIDTGFFAVVDGKGNVIYRTVAHDPDYSIFEVFERDGTMIPHRLDQEKISIELLMPEHRQIKNLIFQAPGAQRDKHGCPENQIISFEEILKKEEKS